MDRKILLETVPREFESQNEQINIILKLLNCEKGKYLQRLQVLSNRCIKMLCKITMSIRANTKGGYDRKTSKICPQGYKEKQNNKIGNKLEVN